MGLLSRDRKTAILDNKEVIARLMFIEDEALRLQLTVRSLIVTLREGLDNDDSE